MPPVNSQILPEDFNGTFTFTNWTDRDFIGRWGGVDYKFPALKTVPMIMNFTPVEIQNIRKKFAKDLAEREYFKSKEYENINAKNKDVNFHSAVTYSPNDLKVFIQRCLEPLPIAKIEATPAPKDSEARSFHTDDKGNPTTKILKSKASGDSADDSVIGDGQVIA